MKPWKAALAAGVLLVSAALGPQGCRNARAAAQQEKFRQYTRALVPRWIEENDMSLNFLFEDKASFGFQQGSYTLPWNTGEDYADTVALFEKVTKELTAFADRLLREDQRLTKAVLLDFMERNSKVLRYYELNNSVLGATVGLQSELPALLRQYGFYNKADLYNYFHILETAPEIFERYAAWEAQRQENGTGLSPSSLKRSIEQCRNFTKEKRPFLVDVMNEAIDRLDFLTDSEKSAAKRNNEKLLTGSLIQAYRLLGDRLSAIEPKCPEKGLAARPRGKEYYEALIQAELGTDWTVGELRSFLNGRIRNCVQKSAAIKKQYPDAWKTFHKVDYGAFTTAEQNMDALRDACASQFPALALLNYEVRQVPEAMAENFSPAVYFVSRIDAPLSGKELIWINGAYKPALFPTIAHEGYPGHMYQNAYYKSTKPDTIRLMLDYQGYSEGWASYVESMSWSLSSGTQEEQAARQLAQLNKTVLGLHVCLWDIGVHYDGWDLARFMKEAEASYGKGAFSRDVLKGQYELTLEIPGNYLSYYVNGSYFALLREEAERQLGVQFDAVGFHKAILDCGPAPQGMVKRQVEDWCKAVKGGRSGASALHRRQALATA